METAAVEWVRSVQQGGGDEEDCAPELFREITDFEGEDISVVSSRKAIRSNNISQYQVDYSMLKVGENVLFVYRWETSSFVRMSQEIVEKTGLNPIEVISSEPYCFEASSNQLHLD